MSQANPGLARRDLREEEQQAMRAAAGFSMQELVALSACAAELFTTGTLPLGDDSQTPDDYVAPALGDDGAATRHGPQEHGQDPRGDGRRGDGDRLARPGPRSTSTCSTRATAR